MLLNTLQIQFYASLQKDQSLIVQKMQKQNSQSTLS